MDRDTRQEICIEKWKKAGGKGILELCVGFGKTTTTLKIIERLVAKKENAKVVVVVPTDYLKGQWELTINKWGFSHNCTVYIINTAMKLETQCDLLALDEVHEYATPNRLKLLEQIKSRFIVGLSGSLQRLDGQEKLLKAVLPVVDKITLEEAVKNSWVAQHAEYKVLLDVDLTEYKKVHTIFIHHFAFFNYDFGLAMSSLDFKVRFNIAKILGKDLSEVMIHSMGFIRALKKRKEFVFNHPRKLEVARQIIEARQDKKILTFSQTKAMAEAVGIGNVMHSGQTKKKRGLIMEAFNKEEVGVLNSAKALERGADIANLSVGINIAFNSSEIAKVQKSGRQQRKEGNKEAEFFTLVLRGTMEEAWFDKSMGKTPYIAITEDQLELLLAGKDYKPKKEKQKEFLFTI